MTLATLFNLFNPQPYAGERRWKVLSRELIHRGDGRPYLDRLTLFKCPWVSVMLHRFHSSDDDCFHCHPWPWVSVILAGGYVEWTQGRNGQEGRWYPPGSVLARRATWRHRLEIDPKRPAWTLVVTGPKCREWGFWTPRFGFVPWRKYSHARHCS